MVEGACLENRCAGDRTGGSNPSLTAVSLENQAVIEIVHKFVHKMRVCELFLFYYTLCASAGLFVAGALRVGTQDAVLRCLGHFVVACSELRLVGWTRNGLQG